MRSLLNFLPLFESESDEAVTCLLEVDLEEDEENAILPPNLSSWPGSTMGESPSLMEMCRRVAAKLSINWPSQQKGQGARGIYMMGRGSRSLGCPTNSYVHLHWKFLVQLFLILIFLVLYLLLKAGDSIQPLLDCLEDINKWL